MPGWPESRGGDQKSPTLSPGEDFQPKFPTFNESHLQNGVRQCDNGLKELLKTIMLRDFRSKGLRIGRLFPAAGYFLHGQT
jgi:hypothetical protein